MMTAQCDAESKLKSQHADCRCNGGHSCAHWSRARWTGSAQTVFAKHHCILAETMLSLDTPDIRKTCSVRLLLNFGRLATIKSFAAGAEVAIDVALSFATASAWHM